MRKRYFTTILWVMYEAVNEKEASTQANLLAEQLEVVKGVKLVDVQKVTKSEEKR